ncbi:AIM24 family protein [Gulosibacter macacae]|uniref:AIM24 family protein n=1 Tax=Gulosibacter macacae TaxID=2488791 RepID=A0A3P3W0Q8_9MICO|nr:AIM24 family protein [Gulosibacter macacae]RRJ87466.1 AIM24 family protein [Gulosibacter macacae]
MRSPIFDQANHRDPATDRWVLESPKLLRLGFGPDAIAQKGAMVAYRGQLDFAHQGSKGMGQFLKKQFTGEGKNLMRVSGQGEAWLAKTAQEIFMMELENEGLTLNTDHVLAFDASLNYEPRMIGNAGMLAGGLFNLEVGGTGTLAVLSDGVPLVLDASQMPVYTDPQATVCWSANLTPTIKNDFKMGALIGRGSGESFQLAFHGPGFVVIQPSEGYPYVPAG